MTKSSSPEPDWAALERLRDLFLRGTAGQDDYWRSERDVASYDATFAQRIGWKWDFVLADLHRRGWSPPRGPLTDWGCGSGVAARAFLDHFGTQDVSRLHCLDRSPVAARYAARRAAERFPGVTVETHPGETTDGTILLSHILTELAPSQTDELLEQLRPARSILWVEPGTYEASLALIAIRERLRGEFQPVAPCTHGHPCGILAAGNEDHWCHHFASPPSAVFTDPFWGRFASLLGIDLRSLPLSYLVLDRRPPPPLPTGSVRTLGRPRVYKAFVRVLACSESGILDESLARRDLPEMYRAARKDRFPSLQQWSRTDGKVDQATAWPPAEESTHAPDDSESPSASTPE